MQSQCSNRKTSIFLTNHCLDAPRKPIDFFQIANLQVPFYRSFLIKIIYLFARFQSSFNVRGWLQCVITLVQRLAVGHYYDVKIS
jgi:hypothetical protein